VRPALRHAATPANPAANAYQPGHAQSTNKPEKKRMPDTIKQTLVMRGFMRRSQMRKRDLFLEVSYSYIVPGISPVGELILTLQPAIDNQKVFAFARKSWRFSAGGFAGVTLSLAPGEAVKDRAGAALPL
jgi:hypothetical protein